MSVFILVFFGIYVGLVALFYVPWAWEEWQFHQMEKDLDALEALHRERVGR